MTATAAWGATAPDSGMNPTSLDRRTLPRGYVARATADCGVCHLNLKLVQSTASIPPLDPGLQVRGFPAHDRYSSIVHRGPERPNWHVFA